MNFCKFISIVFISAIIFFGCNSSAKKTKEISSDSTAYTIPAQPDISPAEYKRYHEGIEDYYENKLVKYGFNGAVLVAKRGHIIFEGYHGFFNLRKKDSLNAHSAFHLASVSKTFTAMATLRLEEEG
ncbi:MAG: serine hydrolase domain-containing protein, partial [Ginsengibacter sp.]